MLEAEHTMNTPVDESRVEKIRHAAKRRKIRAYCSRCRHKQSFELTHTNHMLHLALSILSLGLWTISWVSLAIGIRKNPWRCKHCGWNKPKFPE